MSHHQIDIIRRESRKLGQKAKSKGLGDCPTSDPEFAYYLKFNSTPGLPELPGEMMDSWWEGWEDQ